MASAGTPTLDPKARLLADKKDADDAGATKIRKVRSAGQGPGFTVPAPAGVLEAMMLNGPSDLKLAFRYCDEGKRGHLDREDARRFLRCVGWCLADAHLDEMLDGWKNGQAPANVQISTATGRWDLPSLAKIVKENQDRANSSIEELQTALRSLAGNNARMGRNRLVERTTMGQYSDEWKYVRGVLEAIGAQSSSTVDCDTLAINIMKVITQPASNKDEMCPARTLSGGR
eukprot:TRINITY_DN59809_c0_g1_i1.p1 TRINITY_DN59809_c0_g1~~TRINITY_DN59809_c0_g1_i1.p1  ORF type:complete len:230 (-),score=46.00 TRINITY_DN59809_c0_g1_i1:262-951(-)